MSFGGSQARTLVLKNESDLGNEERHSMLRLYTWRLCLGWF
jgi:hypothetical protein